MAGVRISGLPAVASSLTTDIFPVVQAGVTSKETISQVQTLFGFNTGVLSLSAGGTGKNLTAANNSLVYSDADSFELLAPINSAALVTSLTGLPAWVGPMVNGDLIIGSTGAIPVRASLSAGSGISISKGAGSITISGTGAGIGYTEVTGASQLMVADSGYVANNGLVTLTLPVLAAFGTAISVIGKGAGGWLIAQNALQIIHVGSSASTPGVGGSVASTNRYDSINLICTVANTEWTTVGAPQGVLTVI